MSLRVGYSERSLESVILADSYDPSTLGPQCGVLSIIFIFIPSRLTLVSIRA